MLNLLMWFILLFGSNPQPYSAVLSVNYGTVEVRRSGTEAWLRVPQGAMMPFGAGDEIRTNDSGRAIIYFDDESGVMVIGNSLFRLDEFSQEVDETFIIRGYVEGITLHHYTLPISTYEMQTSELSITQPAEEFAIWAETDIADAVLVASGEVILNQADEEFAVSTNEGYHAAHQAVLEVTPPLSEPRLRSELEGCPGFIETIDDQNLIVRNGSTIDTLPMGAIPDQTPILLLGVSSSGGRYRLQFLSDFGWVDSLAVETECVNLPVFPTPYIEYSPYVVEITADEVAWLAPYFGGVRDDLWFYRFITVEEEN